LNSYRFKDGETLATYTGEEGIGQVFNDVTEIAYDTGARWGRSELQKELKELLNIKN